MVLYDKNEISYSVFAESVMTSAPSMELKKLRVSVLETGETSSNVWEDLSTSSTTSDYFIGTREATTLRIDVEADSRISPQYTFKIADGQATATTMKSSNPGYGYITIPAGTSDPGIVQIKSVSENSAYAPTVYNIRLKRINTAIRSITAGDINILNGYDNDRNLLETTPETVRLTGHRRDPVMMRVNLADREYRDGIKITVYKWIKGRGNSGSYSFIGVADKKGEVQLEGVVGACDVADGYYKVEAVANICGSKLSEGKKTETSTKYYNLDFKN